MSSKRKTIAMLDSSSGSDSDLSESEFQTLAKKRKKSPQKMKKSKSGSGSSSDSDSEVEEGQHRSSSVEPEKEKGPEKSSDVEDGEVSDSDSEIGEFDDGLDEELMGDDEDRRKLEMMNEKEREEEIFKRAEKRELLKKRYEIEKKLKMQKRSTKEEEKSLSKALDTKERSRARKEAVENKKDKKTLALDVLKAKRKEKQEQQQKIDDKKKRKEEESGKDGKKKWKANDIYSSDSSDDEVERNRSRSPEKRRSSSSSSSASSVSSRSRSPSPEKKRETISGIEDLEKIRISRSKVERWCHLPFFNEVIVGCFVRVGIGENRVGLPQYRVCEVLSVEEGPKVYKLGSTRTNKTLKLRHALQERIFRLEFVSSKPFLESEFRIWKEDTMLGGLPLPTLQLVEDKIKHINRVNNRAVNDKDIVHMVREKERFQENPRNYAMTKSRITKDRDAAVCEGNHELAEKLNQRLLEIEERAEDLDRKRSEKISSIALINDRNRKNNIKKAEVNIKEEMEKKKLEGERKDPFTRRKTKPMLATAAIKKAINPNSDIVQNVASTGLKPETKPSQKDISKTEEKKENQPTNDLFDAHDFDIEINLDTFTPNSAIKVSLTPGVNVKENLGPKKSLNLADYKKQRGLI